MQYRYVMEKSLLFTSVTFELLKSAHPYDVGDRKIRILYTNDAAI